MLLAEALWRSTIGKMLLAEALWRSTIGKTLLARAAGETAGENSRQQQTGNGHLTKQARIVNLANQA